MINIGILAAAKSPIYEFLRAYLLAAGRFDVTLTALTPKSDFCSVDLFVLEKTMSGLAELLVKSPCRTVVLDNDDTSIIPALDSLELCVITCGLAQKATVTASSVKENNFTYCLQRSIFDLQGQEILPQEFGIYCRRKLISLSACLLGTTALLLCGENGENLQEFMF